MIKLRECLDYSLPPKLIVNPFLDIFTHLARCEANYSRLRKLLQSPPSGEFHSRLVEFASGAGTLIFDHSSVSRYTSKVVVRQAAHQELTDLHMRVHVYHDTRAAEVVSFQRHSNFGVMGSKPLPPRTLRFEKIELNRFLTDVLDYCLTHGTASKLRASAT